MDKNLNRPYKVWNGNRSIKKSILASSLSDLIIKGTAKLGMSDVAIRVVLEADGTEIDEDEYLCFIENNATLIFLTPAEKWSPHIEQRSSMDETDAPIDTDCLSHRAKQLLDYLKVDIARIITFSDDDLQVLVGVPSSELAQEAGDTAMYTKNIQAVCQRHLDERQSTQEAINLLRLYHKAKSSSPCSETFDNIHSKKRSHSPDTSLS